MALFRFRTRNPQANAAFSQQLVEDERGSVGISSKIDDLTGTMIHYTKRLASNAGREPLPGVKHRSRCYGPLQKFTGPASRGHIPIFPSSYVQCNICCDMNGRRGGRGQDKGGLALVIAKPTRTTQAALDIPAFSPWALRIPAIGAALPSQPAGG